MASNEEYLDSLLKSIDGTDRKETSEEDLSGAVQDASENAGPAGANQETPELSQEIGEALAEEADATGPVTLNDDSEPDNIDMSDMDELLKAVAKQRDNTSGEPEESSWEDGNAEEGAAHSYSEKLSQEEIEKLLAESKAQAEAPEVKGEGESDELNELLDNEQDESLQEIRDLLQKSDSNEAVDDDVLSLLESIPDEIEGKREPSPAFDVFAEEAEETPIDIKAQKAEERRAKREAKKAAKLEKKNKKKAGKASEEKQPVQMAQTDDAAQEAVLQKETEGAVSDIMSEDGIPELTEVPGEDMFSEADGQETENQEPAAVVKKGFFSKVLDFFTEEEEEENEDIPLSEENENILKEMDQESQNGKKKKKSKKKKGKQPEAAAEDGEGEGSAKEKGKKTKKEKKPKKEKAPREAQQDTGGKKLSFKKMLPIFLICISFGAVLILGANLSGNYMDRKNAQKAYYEENYQECYQSLFGKELNESEQVMFYKSQYVLRMRLYLKEYEQFEKLLQETQALDCLVEAVKDYPALSEEAAKWNASQEVGQVYQQILGILNDKYQLSEAQAMEIAREADDLVYTRMITAIAEGSTLDAWREEQSQKAMVDVLPEEEELADIPFVEGNAQGARDETVAPPENQEAQSGEQVPESVEAQPGEPASDGLETQSGD